MKKRLLSIILTLVLCLGLLPVTVTAGGGGTITSSGTADEIIAAFDGNAALSGSTITLTGDVTVSDTVIFESGDWTLDLATYTLTGANKKAAIRITGGSLTVTGSGSVKGGIGAVAIQTTGGSLTIRGSVSITGGTGDYGSSGGWNGIRPGAGGSGGAAIDSTGCDITIDGGVTIRGGDGGHGGDDIATYGTTNGGTGGSGAAAIQATGGRLTIRDFASITGGTGGTGGNGGSSSGTGGAGGSGGAAIAGTGCDITISGTGEIYGGAGGNGGNAGGGNRPGGAGGSGAAAVQATEGSLTIRNSVSITGGTGGNGGNGAPGGYQGSGGAGGSGGVAIAGTGCGITISDNGTICGGNGGNGGKGGNHVYETNGGNGGIGGGGIQVDGGSLTIRNSVSITGGAGGSGGTGGSSRGKGGAGGSGGNVIGAQDTSLEVSDSVSRTGGNGGAGGSGGSSGSSGGSGSSGSSEITGNYFRVEGGSWTVIGNVTVSEDKTINADLIVGAGATLTINSGATLTVNGSVTNNGTITGSGTLSPKLNQTAPANAPVIKSVTDNSITLDAVPKGMTDAEYAYITGDETADSIPDGRWQSGTTVSGLQPATNYTFFVRYKGTGIYNPSGLSSGRTAYTAFAAPGTGEGYSVDYIKETIAVYSGYEVNKDSSFNSATAVAGGSAVTPGQRLYIRKAASGDIPAGTVAQFKLPNRPAKPKVTVNYVTSTLTTTAAMEYKVGEGKWTTCTENMDASTFGWDGSAEVTVQFRTKATQTCFAGETAFVTIMKRDANTMVLELIDDCGDGWNDAKLMVYGDDRLLQEILPEYGYGGIVFLSYMDAATYSFRWQKGDFDEEIGLTVWMPGSEEPVFKAEPYYAGYKGYFTDVENGALLFTLDILKITAQPADQEITYGESAYLTVTARNYFDTDELTYRWYQVEGETETELEGETDSTLSRAGLNAGTYTYYCKVSYGSITVESDRAAVTVAKADGMVTITSDPGKVYDGTAVSMQGKYTVVGGGAVTVEYKQRGASDKTYTKTAPTDAGSYTVRITVSAGSNYTSASVTKDFNITKAPQSAPDAPVVRYKTHTGVTLEIIPANANGAKAQYSIDGGRTWQYGNTFNGLNPKTEYSFTVRYEETDNYSASPSGKSVSAATYDIPVTTYPPIVEQPGEGGNVTVLPEYPGEGSVVTIVPEPGKGYEVDKVTVTDRNGAPVQVTDNGDGTYSFTQPEGKVNVKVTFAEKEVIHFEDVPADAYYYDAVYWAVNNGIAEGTNAEGTLFSPDAPCTRAQAVTFLWRAAGCPAPKGSAMPFTDVAKGSYYETAVMWAVEQGITVGTSATTFSPDSVCTRAQIITFLWRSQKSPVAGTDNPFEDVKADAYYIDAVLWAVKNGVTEGTNTAGTAFSPDNKCSRAQIIAFIWRALAE